MRRYRLYESFTMKWHKPFFLFNPDFYEWIFYWIYGRSSGFTQSILTPFFLIISTIFVFAIIYHYDSLNTFSNIWHGFADSLQKSLAAALPLFKTEFVYSNWWIKSLKTFICSTLLVFFILALRKRFKQ